ncbi:hypothetical protein GLAREA_04922 [Glarea lozoyensis ATCC 20868]|uniref:Fungal N-terminal domain-containing protein n=1 Tax=Glarea lozoyensis (strain ATCC 20868 / MF5171) TaxID=1116229 RepID=S3D7Y9_GLAL2|nr:uncharacterized protein GLAREA_04922 [Glarea lozoyensis ATCC 20868]EPE28131.1 hypothetical protein GLAREA_04922 [Glarea lozoyensis ATCC 20868]
MESLAAAGGVIAVVSLAGQVVQGCIHLRDVFDGARSAPKDIRSLATELKIIKDVVEATTNLDQHPEVLDFCNEKIVKLRKIVDKYGVADDGTDKRRWGSRLAMALNSDKIQKHLNSLREAKRHLEQIQNVSAHSHHLIKTIEVFDTVHEIQSSQNDSVQILNRAENKLNSVDATTKQTHEALVRFAKDVGERQSEGATVKDVHNIMQMVRSVETMIQNQLLQDQIRNSHQLNSISTIRAMSELPPTDLESSSAVGRIRNQTSTAGFEQVAEDHSSDNSNSQLQRVNQLVDIAIKVRYKQGKPIVGVIATKDQDFEVADFETKRCMVKLLQDLRLLTWLFTHNNNLERDFQRRTSSPQSLFIYEDDLTSTWNWWKIGESVGASSLGSMSTDKSYKEESNEYLTVILTTLTTTFSTTLSTTLTRYLDLLGHKWNTKSLPAFYPQYPREVPFSRIERQCAMILYLLDLWLYCNEYND